MRYDFDKLTERLGTNCVKWDEAESKDVLPMWVADMDFEVAPCITKALHERIDHAVFGYSIVPDSYYEATINWFGRRHQWKIERDWIQYTSGVVPAISCCIKALTRPGDGVIVMTPAYNCFFSSVRNNGCVCLENALLPSPTDEEGIVTFTIDWDDLEAKAAEERTKVLLFCNPHNPVGRLWTKEEMLRVNEICLCNGVVVLSDEIHCELVMRGHKFTPFASVSAECQQNCITLNSPTKNFNIAGLQIANIICSRAEWRKMIDRAINDNEVCDVNPFGVIALQAAYNEGEEWLTQLDEYLSDNYEAMKEFFRKEMPQIPITRLEGTYLVWADVSSTGMTAEELSDLLIKEGKVWMNGGKMYHDPASQQHLRINIACQRSRMMEGLRRMSKVIYST